MLELPIELQRQCLHALDIKTLKAFRLVSKAALAIATEILFYTVNILPTNQSVEKYMNIIEDEKLNPLVRQAIFNTSEDPDAYEISNEEIDLLDPFAEAIREVTRFSNLREVELKFARECAAEDDTSGWDKEVAETISFRTEVLDIFFATLENAESVETLTVKNLQDYTKNEIYDSDEFKKVRDRLKKLHLQIATEHDDAAPENSISLEGCHQGFGRLLLEHWLNPLHERLTHLTVYGESCFWGIWPFVDLRKVPTFTHLKSLSLGNFTIAHDWQIDWIVSHSNTLEELLLDDCPIITALRMDEEQMRPNFPELIGKPIRADQYSADYLKHVHLRWHHVFPRFQSSLPHLRCFALGQGNWNECRAFELRYELINRVLESRYILFDFGIGPSQWTGGNSERKYDFHLDEYVTVELPDKECDRQDMQALGELMKVVQERGSGKA